MSQKIDINEAKALIDWMNLSEDIREFSLKCGDLELFISRNEHTLAAAPAPASAPAAPTPTSAPAPAAAVAVTPTKEANKKGYEPAADEHVIRAPMVGTFYASPKPGAPAFVKEGDSVSKQTVMCIVEVMKLMNNIEAGVEGVVHKILVENEQPVEYNQPLLVIKLKA